MLITWLCLVFWLKLIENKILLLLGTSIIFLLIILVEILRNQLVDLNAREIKKIWWSRVFLILTISFLISMLIVYRKSNFADIVQVLINSAAFGIVLGYGVRRFEEKAKSKEDG